MSGVPPIIKDTYNHRLPGVYGQFGAGAGVNAFYIQSALQPSQLDWVSLISDIRGSECWQVRDLFQRDVDNERVTGWLLPYLQNSEKIKFFNPVTLTLLPMQENEVLTQMPKVALSTLQDENVDWEVLERTGYHRIRWIKDNPQYAMLEWSDARTKLVAIDGQHRLSALKRFWKDHGSAAHRDFRTWRIPIVVVSFRVGPQRAEPPSVLEVVRSIFVYINTEAREINSSRKILLSDESVNAVCTQELVQLAHHNDLKPEGARDPCRLPLLFYDWRGEESEKRRIHAPAAVKSVEEIYNWFEYYLLGEDFSDEQETALRIDPGQKSLHAAFHGRKLTHANSKLIRELAQDQLLPAICHLLENFAPYQSYVAALRELEEYYQQNWQSDLVRHAFHELRFGANLAPEAIRPAVTELLDEIKSKVEETQEKHLHSPINLDIGMRGVICAFGALRRIGNIEWKKHAIWFTDSINRTYENGWLDLSSRTPRRNFLRHIAENHDETIINYRLEDADAALGTYLQLLVMAYGSSVPEILPEDNAALKEDLLETLRSKIARGFRKEVRPILKREFPDGGRPLTEAVNREADKLARKQIRRFERELEKIVAGASES